MRKGLWISYSSEEGAPTGIWAHSQQRLGSVGWQCRSAVELTDFRLSSHFSGFGMKYRQVDICCMWVLSAADFLLVLRLLLEVDTCHFGMGGDFCGPSKLSSLRTGQCRCHGAELGEDLTPLALACSLGKPQQCAQPAHCLLPLPVAELRGGSLRVKRDGDGWSGRSPGSWVGLKHHPVTKAHFPPALDKSWKKDRVLCEVFGL